MVTTIPAFFYFLIVRPTLLVVNYFFSRYFNFYYFIQFQFTKLYPLSFFHFLSQVRNIFYIIPVVKNNLSFYEFYRFWRFYRWTVRRQLPVNLSAKLQKALIYFYYIYINIITLVVIHTIVLPFNHFVYRSTPILVGTNFGYYLNRSFYNWVVKTAFYLWHKIELSFSNGVIKLLSFSHRVILFCQYYLLDSSKLAVAYPLMFYRYIYLRLFNKLSKYVFLSKYPRIFYYFLASAWFAFFSAFAGLGLLYCVLSFAFYCVVSFQHNYGYHYAVDHTFISYGIIISAIVGSIWHWAGFFYPRRPKADDYDPWWVMYDPEIYRKDYTDHDNLMYWGENTYMEYALGTIRLGFLVFMLNPLFLTLNPFSQRGIFPYFDFIRLIGEQDWVLFTGFGYWLDWYLAFCKRGEEDIPYEQLMEYYSIKKVAYGFTHVKSMIGHFRYIDPETGKFYDMTPQAIRALLKVYNQEDLPEPNFIQPPSPKRRGIFALIDPNSLLGRWLALVLKPLH